MHPLQQIEQGCCLTRRQQRQGFVAGFVGHRPDAAEDRPRLGGQVKAAGAAVGRVGVTLDPARLLHAVDLADQRHRPDFQEVGQAGLVDALVARQVAERAALRPGQAEAPPIMVEAPPEQARDIVDEKAETAFEIQHAASNRTPG